jgi:hypothetical protein
MLVMQTPSGLGPVAGVMLPMLRFRRNLTPKNGLVISSQRVMNNLGYYITRNFVI